MRTEVREQRSEVSARRVAAVVRRRLTFPWCLGQHSISRALTSAATALALGIALTAADARAQNFSIDWFTIDGGGGTSTGGVFAMSGTIGQPDAGVMSGTNASGQSFTLVGGFWGVFAAVQTPGGPLLTVTRTPTNTVVVSWPLPDTGWKLHATTNLITSGSVWTELAPPYATNATSLYFVEPTPAGNKFYRLHKP